jgi:para-nitrobenzyl esterase
MLCVCVWLTLIVGAALVHAQTVSSLVRIDSGLVQGSANTRYGGYSWLGIPFAGSVSGARRFMPSAPPAPWSNTFDATQWPVGCLSVHHNPDVANVTVEDCLNLDVYVPAGVTQTSKLPILFWIHGGGFAEGANTGPFDLYSGSHMANYGNVIVV